MHNAYVLRKVYIFFINPNDLLASLDRCNYVRFGVYKFSKSLFIYFFFFDHVIVFQQFSCSQYYILQIQHMEHERCVCWMAIVKVIYLNKASCLLIELFLYFSCSFFPFSMCHFFQPNAYTALIKKNNNNERVLRSNNNV